MLKSVLFYLNLNPQQKTSPLALQIYPLISPTDLATKTLTLLLLTIAILILILA